MMNEDDLRVGLAAERGGAQSILLSNGLADRALTGARRRRRTRMSAVAGVAMAAVTATAFTVDRSGGGGPTVHAASHGTDPMQGAVPDPNGGHSTAEGAMALLQFGVQCVQVSTASPPPADMRYYAWDPASRKYVVTDHFTSSGQWHGTTELFPSPDGKRALVVENTADGVLWSVAAWSDAVAHRGLTFHKSPFSWPNLHWSPDGKYVVSAPYGYDSTKGLGQSDILFYDPETGVVATMVPIPGAVHAAADREHGSKWELADVSGNASNLTYLFVSDTADAFEWLNSSGVITRTLQLHAPDDNSRLPGETKEMTAAAIHVDVSPSGKYAVVETGSDFSVYDLKSGARHGRVGHDPQQHAWGGPTFVGWTGADEIMTESNAYPPDVAKNVGRGPGWKAVFQLLAVDGTVRTSVQLPVPDDPTGMCSVQPTTGVGGSGGTLAPASQFPGAFAP